MEKRYIALVVLLFIYLSNIVAQTTKYGPMMGWSSWNTYRIDISDQLIKNQANAMVSKGLSKVGYQYINIDDGYWGGRDAETGELLTHPTRFPKGVKGVVDYIHGKGLKAGIYSDAGVSTCASRYDGDTYGVGVGMWEHYDQDMKWWFVDHDFDFIKVDFCGGEILQGEGKKVNDKILYGYVFDALEKVKKSTGKDIRINVCRWSYPGTWVEKRADSWRTTGDIYCAWESVRGIINANLYMSAFSSAGHFNDMDMLEVGRSLNKEEDITHFVMWCMLNSPLMIGCDMASIDKTTLKLLTFSDYIAINQDTLYKQAYVVDNQDGAYLLVRDVESAYDTMRVAAVYNPSNQDVNYVIKFDKLDLGGKVKVRYINHVTGSITLNQLFEDSYTIKVPAHGTRVFRFDAEERKERTLYEAECGYLSCYHEVDQTSANFASQKNCSGGMKVGYIGETAENDLQWRNVYSKTGGKYKCTIGYLTKEERKFTLEVNGQKVRTFSVRGLGFEDTSTTTCEINLNPGENIVRIYNESKSFAPDMDYMKLQLIEPLAVKTTKTKKVKHSKIIDLRGRVIDDIKSQPSGTVLIKDNKAFVK